MNKKKLESAIYLSMVVPMFNEEGNIEELHSRLSRVLKLIGKSFELIFVDDGSTDKTYQKLNGIYEKDEYVHLIRLGRNFGQTAALAAGFDYARGNIVISMDGDLQHDPEDIPKFVKKIEEGYDIVSGWRKERKDSFLIRRLPSMVANKIIAKISGVSLHDFGTTFKAYKKELISNLRIYGGQHRFIPALLSWAGISIAEVPIKNTLRNTGKSNYSLWRIFKVFYDLFILNFLVRYLSNPLLIFGSIGLFFICSGLIITLCLSIGWFWFDLNMIENRGILLLSILCIIMGIQFMTTGLISEVITRIYYETQNKRPYAIREIKTRR